MDNLTTLRQFAGTPLTDVFLFAPPPTVRGLDRAAIDYYLKAQPKALTIDVPRREGPGGALVHRSAAARSRERSAGDDDVPRGPPRTVPMAAGLNRVDVGPQLQPIASFPGMVLWGATQNGPMVLPGTYQVRLTADGVTATQPLTIVKHPLRNISDADLQYQWDLASRIRDKVNEANQAVIRIRRIKTDIAARIEGRAEGSGGRRRDADQANCRAVEEDIYQVQNQSGQDPLNFPIKTNNRLASLLRVAVVGRRGGRPATSSRSSTSWSRSCRPSSDRLNKTVATELADPQPDADQDQEGPDQRQVAVTSDPPGSMSRRSPVVDAAACNECASHLSR